MEFLQALEENDVIRMGDYVRRHSQVTASDIVTICDLELDAPAESKEVNDCRQLALNKPWPAPKCPCYPSSGPDPAVKAGQRRDPSIILATIQLMNTRTYEGLAAANRLWYHAVGLKGPLEIKAQAGLCDVMATNCEVIVVTPWVLTPLFDSEPPHFPLPKTELLTVSHVWLAWMHEWGHILRDSTESGADSCAIDMIIAACCVTGDIRSLQQTLHARFRNGDYDLDRVDELNNTSLCIAAEEGHALLVAFLMENGASPTARNGAGQLPIELARRNGHKAIEVLLSS